MKVVLDTNVLARAHQKAQGPARRILLHVISGPDVHITSPYILRELERVLSYPRLLKRSGLTSKDVAEYLDILSALSCLVIPEAIPANVLRDAADTPILGTALAGRAEVLCTRDADFYEQSVQRFCAANGIQVMTDLQFINAFKI